MRTRLSWVLTVLGVLSALFGVTVMVILGPDSRFTTGPHEVDTDGFAVVTAPKVITWADVQIDVLAEVPAEKPVFVGLGNTVDVQNFVAGVSRLEVTSFHTPWKVATREVEGKSGLPGAATALDWWRASSAGRGGASISTTLPDETVSLAIVSVGDSNLSGLKVTLAYGIKGGFIKGLGLLLLGAGAVLASRLMRRGENIWAEVVDEDEEEVVYVYVDEDGVEHEISADKAEDYEIVEVEDDDDPEPTKPADDEAVEVPVPPADAVSENGFVTSVAAKVASTFARKPKKAPELPDETDDDEELVYIYVDADGVEHEISAEEAEAYEFIDEVVVEVDDAPVIEPTTEPAPLPEPQPLPVAEPEPEPGASKERVIYVMVDEDGVEHEVSEEELADFEIVEEEEGKS